eukprot:356225-Chlamydomonas_euryale.AAC.9
MAVETSLPLFSSQTSPVYVPAQIAVPEDFLTDSDDDAEGDLPGPKIRRDQHIRGPTGHTHHEVVAAGTLSICKNIVNGKEESKCVKLGVPARIQPAAASCDCFHFLRLNHNQRRRGGAPGVPGAWCCSCADADDEVGAAVIEPLLRPPAPSKSACSGCTLLPSALGAALVLALPSGAPLLDARLPDAPDTDGLLRARACE